MKKERTDVIYDSGHMYGPFFDNHSWLDSDVPEFKHKNNFFVLAHEIRLGTIRYDLQLLIYGPCLNEAKNYIYPEQQVIAIKTLNEAAKTPFDKMYYEVV